MLALSGHSRQLRAMGVDEVLEIGPGAAAAQRVGPLKHQFLGRLPAQEVAGVLQSARFALLDYPAHCLGKSSVFAAYAACGNAVLNSWPAAPDADGVRSGCHYLRLTEVSTGGRAAVAPADMATALHSWYRSHPLALQARELLALVRI